MNLELEPIEVMQIVGALQAQSNHCQVVLKKIQDMASPTVPPAAATGPGITPPSDQPKE
jgi:hypothetical protein